MIIGKNRSFRYIPDFTRCEKGINGNMRGNTSDSLPLGFSTGSYTGFPQLIHRKKTEIARKAISL